MSVTATYRGLLRELRKSSIFPRSARNPSLTASLRTTLFQGTPKDDKSDLLQAAENTTLFLRSNRIHKVAFLPLHDLSEEERIKATARRVGLNTPKEYKP